ncbi:hypothetical protein Dda_8678 [Drechslerella dactyloides]|uniref:Uncharacterized protein n=1 Tax=Drechslerella dactyloides TaxID=74499 RepID=A0AAD6NFV4_DREDA|nr:hypothetical protein Dda_8678 [Drechslerella dactyloides]
MGIDAKNVSPKLPGFLKDSLIGVLIAIAAIALLVFTAVVIPRVVKYRQAQRRRPLHQQTDGKDSEGETAGILAPRRADTDPDLESSEGKSDGLKGLERPQLRVLEPELPLDTYHPGNSVH